MLHRRAAPTTFYADFSDVAYGLAKCISASDRDRESITDEIKSIWKREHCMVTLSVRFVEPIYSLQICLISMCAGRHLTCCCEH